MQTKIFLRRALFFGAIYIVSSVVILPLFCSFLFSALSFAGQNESSLGLLKLVVALVYLYFLPMIAFFPPESGVVAIPSLPLWAGALNTLILSSMFAMSVEALDLLGIGVASRLARSIDSIMEWRFRSPFANDDSTEHSLQGGTSLRAGSVFALALVHFLIGVTVLFLALAHEMNTDKFEGPSWICLQLMLFPVVPLLHAAPESGNVPFTSFLTTLFGNSVLFSIVALACKRALQEVFGSADS